MLFKTKAYLDNSVIEHACELSSPPQLTERNPTYSGRNHVHGWAKVFKFY